MRRMRNIANSAATHLARQCSLAVALPSATATTLFFRRNHNDPRGCGTFQLTEATVTLSIVGQFVGDGTCNCGEPLVDHVEGIRQRCTERTRNNALRRPRRQSAQPPGKRRQFASCISGLIVSRESSQQNHGPLHARIVLLCILP